MTHDQSNMKISVRQSFARKTYKNRIKRLPTYSVHSTHLGTFITTLSLDPVHWTLDPAHAQPVESVLNVIVCNCFESRTDSEVALV